MSSLVLDAAMLLPLQAARFGIGAATEGVWYFAFGANINANKLGQVRGIHPLESAPAFVSGWRLAFNHRYTSSKHPMDTSGGSPDSPIPCKADASQSSPLSFGLHPANSLCSLPHLVILLATLGAAYSSSQEKLP